MPSAAGLILDGRDHGGGEALAVQGRVEGEPRKPDVLGQTLAILVESGKADDPLAVGKDAAGAAIVDAALHAGEIEMKRLGGVPAPAF